MAEEQEGSAAAIEEPATAHLLNNLFSSIEVDGADFPDIDVIYIDVTVPGVRELRRFQSLCA